MKLIIQIPCFNEEANLAATVADLPREIPGVDAVEILVVDDGSTDATSAVALDLGVDHVVRHRRNQGLAAAFRTGLETCLRLGADVIVNTDADNQYAGGDVPKLLAPILCGEADIVVGDRQTATLDHFSPTKRLLQRIGSLVVSRFSETDTPDAVSGFRALTADAAREINVLSSFSYTIEMLIQAGKKRLAVATVPITVNPHTRPSRLFRSIPQFLLHSLTTMVRTYTTYHPLRVFTAIGSVLLLLGAVPVIRFLYFFSQGDGAGHVQSLVIGGTAIVLGGMTLLIGLTADLVASNRRLLEMLLERERLRTIPPPSSRVQHLESSLENRTRTLSTQ